MNTLLGRLGERRLTRYPANAQRIWYLALAVGATMTLYYELFTLVSVAALVQADFHLSLAQYGSSVVVANILGALAAPLGSLSDRLGRGNLIVCGLMVSGSCTLAIAVTPALWSFLLLYWVLGTLQGLMLTVMPALVRDFSPRVGRAAAMVFWTLGPVGGSFVAALVASQTLPLYHTWRS